MSTHDDIATPLSLRVEPPFVWPEPRFHVGQVQYAEQPPFDSLVCSADMIAGVLVGAADQTVQWVDTLMRKAGKRRVVLVLVTYPACPTREEHLLSLKILQAQGSSPESVLDLRVLPAARVFGSDFEKPVLPPTMVLAHNAGAGKSWLCFGSVGDAGRDPIQPGSFNAVFQPDDALRDNWRRWFQYLLEIAAPLTPETVRIPHLVPAPGDRAGAEMWAAFEAACQSAVARGAKLPLVDPKTGEVIATVGGEPVKWWDCGATALDPLAQKLQQAYARGFLVTVDETTRSRPLAIPVKATLLGQQARRTLGAITQRQAFSLEVFDGGEANGTEKYRQVTDLMDLLTYLLSHGNRWLPEAAKVFLEKELEARNAKGLATLKAALGGCEPGDFASKRRQKITDDLNAMFQQLGQGQVVPDDKLAVVLAEVEKRLSAVLNSRMTPRAIYNRIAPPDLTVNAPDQNWCQPLSLLLRSARLVREFVKSSGGTKRLSGLSFTEQEYLGAMNIFDDAILKSGDSRRAKGELAILDEIEASADKPRQKCAAVWQIISANRRNAQSER